MGAPVRLSQVGAFLLIAYAVSWTWLVPIALDHGVVRPGQGWPTHFPALLGPLVAAFVVTASRQGRRGVRDLVRRMLRFRAPLRWWAFAVSPLVVLALVVVIDHLRGRPGPPYAGFAVFSGLSSDAGVLGVAALVLLVNGFGEETGWRGFALPHLQRRFGPLRATFILSGFWALWHTPMFFVVESFRSFSLPVLIGWTIGLLCGAVVLTWLYNRSGGSILLVAIWHSTYNLVSGTEAANGVLAAVSTTAVIIVAGLLIGLEVRAARTGRHTVIGPPEAL